jgi:hypothetical protein
VVRWPAAHPRRRPVARLGQQLKVIALIFEAGVVAAHDTLQQALASPVRVVCQLCHALREHLVRTGKVGQDGARVTGPARDVVRRIVRVDDGEPVVVLVSEVGHLVLRRRTRPVSMRAPRR